MFSKGFHVFMSLISVAYEDFSQKHCLHISMAFKFHKCLGEVCSFLLLYTPRFTMRNCFCANNTRQNLFIEVAIINAEKLKKNLKTRTEEELCNIARKAKTSLCTFEIVKDTEYNLSITEAKEAS